MQNPLADYQCLIQVGVVVKYPERTLTATPSCSNHSNTAFNETYLANQSNLNVYILLSSEIETRSN